MTLQPGSSLPAILAAYLMCGCLDDASSEGAPNDDATELQLSCTESDATRGGCEPAICILRGNRALHSGTTFEVRSGEDAQAGVVVPTILESGEAVLELICSDSRPIRVRGRTGEVTSSEVEVDCSGFGADAALSFRRASNRVIHPGGSLDLIVNVAHCDGEPFNSIRVLFKSFAEIGGIGSTYLPERTVATNMDGNAGVTFRAGPGEYVETVVVGASLLGAAHAATATTTFYVDAGLPLEGGVFCSPGSTVVAFGQQSAVSCVGLGQGGWPADGAPIEFDIRNGDGEIVPEVATADESGNAEVTFQAGNVEGPVQIDAVLRIANGVFRDQVTIEVLDHVGL